MVDCVASICPPPTHDRKVIGDSIIRHGGCQSRGPLSQARHQQRHKKTAQACKPQTNRRMGEQLQRAVAASLVIGSLKVQPHPIEQMHVTWQDARRALVHIRKRHTSQCKISTLQVDRQTSSGTIFTFTSRLQQDREGLALHRTTLRI